MTNQEKFIQIFGIIEWQRIIAFSGLADRFKEYWTSPYTEPIAKVKNEDDRMIFDQRHFDKDLRNLFCNTVTEIFGDSTTFLDFLENEKYSTKYDCYLDYNGENYIINRETGEYINWYKLSHIGRCINILTLPTCKSISRWIEKFLIEFKESEDKK